MKKKKSRLPVFIMSILLLAAAGMIGTGIYLIFFKNRDAYERQDEERELADTYIEDLILQINDPVAYEEKIKEEKREREERLKEKLNARGDKKEGEDITGEDYSLPYEEYADENYYSSDGITYTPDYAKGVIDCVLEVPTAGIRRGVYTGTWEEINYDLDIWMVTVARPDYTLGETHYCIYGHNHTEQDLSFNRLQKVQVGEEFYLTAKSGRYTYEITNVFAVSREEASSDYVDNFGIGSDKCYIITCGRDDGVRNFRYLDLIVEGTLKEHLSIEEYARKLGK